MGFVQQFTTNNYNQLEQLKAAPEHGGSSQINRTSRQLSDHTGREDLQNVEDAHE
jgi:hypothetical protein